MGRGNIAGIVRRISFSSSQCKRKTVRKPPTLRRRGFRLSSLPILASSITTPTKSPSKNTVRYPGPLSTLAASRLEPAIKKALLKGIKKRIDQPAIDIQKNNITRNSLGKSFLRAFRSQNLINLFKQALRIGKAIINSMSFARRIKQNSRWNSQHMVTLC